VPLHSTTRGEFALVLMLMGVSGNKHILSTYLLPTYYKGLYFYYLVSFSLAFSSGLADLIVLVIFFLLFHPKRWIVVMR